VVLVEVELAVGAVGVVEAAVGELAGGVITGAAGELGGVFFRSALGASIDVEPYDGAARVDDGLREVDGVEGVGVGGVAELVDEGGDLGVGGGFSGGEG